MNIIENLNAALPNYETILPISKRKVYFTPFKVKDIKNLAIILEEKNKKAAFIGMINILSNNCIEFKNIIDDICLADAEYLFLQIRSKSIEEKLNLIVDGEKVQLDISDISSKNKMFSEVIFISDTMNIELKTPSIKDLLNMKDFTTEDLIKTCIKKIILKNEIYFTNKFVPDQLKQILDNLPLSCMSKIEAFLKKQPELYANININGETKEVSGMLNFFIFQ
jgi:hypothetical protein